MLDFFSTGSLKSLTAPTLGAKAIKQSVEKVGLPLDSVQEVLMGCVVQGSNFPQKTQDLNDIKAMLNVMPIIEHR